MPAAALTTKLGAYARLMRLHRPIGTLLLLWPTLWALWIAGEGSPPAWIVVVFVVGTLLMRSAGCVINDYADRDFDPHVQRTAERPLASGEVRPGEAIALFVALCLVAFGLVLLLNRLTLYLALVAVVLAATYPFFKRFTHMPQAYLGVAFGWGIPMSFAAVSGQVPAVAWILLAANIFWTVAYDTMYAMEDRPDDLAIGVRSTAILFGRWDRVAVGVNQLIALALMGVVGYLAGFGVWYALGLLGAVGFGLYQHWLIRDRARGPCLRAFLNNQWLGGAVFAGIVLEYLTA
ncbi:4-hydroxybenzoate polyprenyltransferase [Thiohalorhabdus denitrificans]|uniref:4-hydroxybenzoate octaprenyltransferase n=1 Tax=Thiohalorhabdus denitrificans TaxID=381306 RepID=A0A0P9CX79_9GAMM|nr:4-hydroxybenzoate octaprenyltransferase [Thiohalorhabdus denitrificans]KPV41447.1 4-hydroxybenzoate polyprenyltransferase [Thiohalorhabdus denitrificans]SCY27671.1 4-hydroxybenzoate polyprenyltransferase [Thiohalorhabdus denitrificans]